MKSSKVAATQELNNEIALLLLKSIDTAIESLENYERRISAQNFTTPHDAELIIKCRVLRGQSEQMQSQLSQRRKNSKQK